MNAVRIWGLEPRSSERPMLLSGQKLGKQRSMTINGWIQILVFLGIAIALVKPLGGYITRVMTGERTILSTIFGPLERGLYRIAGTSEKEEQHWTTYMAAMLLFNLAGFALL
jgi:K+-transporting ATPase ATPase A chain